MAQSTMSCEQWAMATTKKLKRCETANKMITHIELIMFVMITHCQMKQVTQLPVITTSQTLLLTFDSTF